MLHQIAHREIGGIALPVVAVFLAQLKALDIRHLHDFAAITTSFKHSLDDPLVLPRQATEENGYLASLLGGEGPLNGTLEMADGPAVESHHARQPRALAR